MIHAMFDKNISNFELSDMVGVQDSYIALLRHGRRNPSVEVAKKIEKILGEDNLFNQES